MAENSESGKVGEVWLQMGLDDSGVGDVLGGIEKKIKSAFKKDPVDGVNTSLGSTESITKAINKQMTSLASKVAVAFSLSKIKSFAAECESLSNTQNFAEQKLTSVMTQRMKATEAEIQSVKDLASSLQDVGVVGDEVAIAGAAKLAAYTDSVEGLLGLMPEMENLAVSLYGTDVSTQVIQTVATQIGKALANDSLTGLVRVGISPTDADTAAWKELSTSQEKAAFLAQLIRSRIGDVNGSLSESLIIQTQLNNKTGDIKEKLGGIYQLFIVPIRKMLLNIATIADNVLSKVSSVLGLQMTKTEQNINSAAKTTGDYFESTQKSAEKLERYLMGFDKINKLGGEEESTAVTTPELSLDSDSEPLTQAVKFDYVEGGFADRIRTALSKIGEGISKYLGDKFNLAFNGDAIESFVSWLEKLGDWVEEHPDEFAAWIDGVLKFVKALGLIIIVVKVIGWLVDLFSVASSVVTFLAGIGGAISAPWLLVIAAIAALVLAFIYAKDNLIEMLEGIKTYFKGLIDFWVGLLTGDFSRAWEGLKTCIKGVWDFCVGLGKAAWNILKGIAKAAVNVWNKIRGKTATAKVEVDDSDLGADLGSYDVAVTHFATGGYVEANTPRLAVVGDNKTNGEYILPENKLLSLMEKSRSMGTATVDNTEIIEWLKKIYELISGLHLEGSVDMGAIARLVWKLAAQEQRATGRNPVYG